jgi:hypothetical protein
MNVMTSRYDYMKVGEVIDEETMDSYPDPLSTNYATGTITVVPRAKQLTSGELEKWWKYYYDLYGKLDTDDIFLNINGVPYLGMLEAGSVIFELNTDDVVGWLKNQTTDED